MALFNHLIGSNQKLLWYIEAERVGGLEVNHQFIFGRCLHRQIGWLLALQDAIDVTGSSTELSRKVSRIGDQAAARHEFPLGVNCWQSKPSGERNDKFAINQRVRA